MNALRILILTPTTLPTVTGNAMTVERWRYSLSALGHEVKTLPTLSIDRQSLTREILSFQPQVIHAHHVLKAGAVLQEMLLSKMTCNIPFVVSPAGTDINGCEKPEEMPESFLKVCRSACRTVVQSSWMLERLRNLFPDLADRFICIPKAFMWQGDDPYDLKKACGYETDTFVFFLPAGIRPVKGNLECLRWLAEVHRHRTQMRVVFAGPALDQTYAAEFGAAVAHCSSFAALISLIPPAAMRSAYRSADVTLNVSVSEGQSNTLLEAIAAGQPVLASDIPGNQWPVLGNESHRPCGLLFDRTNPDDFFRKAIRLIDDEALRRNLVDACTERAADFPKPEEEAARLDQVYRSIL